MRSKFFLVLIFCFNLYSSFASDVVVGCTDSKAKNFNHLANFNDGSCVYKDTVVHPLSSVQLPDNVNESSGMIFWNKKLWTHNDSGSDINFYAIDSISGKVLQTYTLLKTKNVDWEEMAQDSNYIYLGDFGNNCGCRKDLRIVRIPKNKIFTLLPKLDTLSFTYPDQLNFDPKGNQKTNFDCEAMIVQGDSIYLFSKQWLAGKTTVYALGKNPGTQVAKIHSSYDVQGLITGACYTPMKGVVALTGYSHLLQPFIFLLYDFKGTDFFGGNKRKLELSLMFHQVEAIATVDGLSYFISNEYFSKRPYVETKQQLHHLDLSSFLKP